MNLDLEPAHRRYLWGDQGLGAFVLNFAFNAGFAWLAFGAMATVPLWGNPGIVADTVGTSFILSFATTVIVTRLVHREVRRGRFPAPAWRRTSHPTLGRLPAGTFRRALLFGSGAVAAGTPVVVAVFAAAGVDAVPLVPFVWFKAGYAGALAAFVAPTVALSALGDTVADSAT